MILKEDKSYISGLDMELINKGYAKLDIHSVHIDRHLSEEQKEENRKQSELLTSEQWNKRCNNYWYDFSKKLEPITEQLDKEFLIYQYKKELNYNSDEWELYFYSDKGWNNQNYFTRFQLSPNSKRSLEQRLIDIEKLINTLKNMNLDDNFSIRIQYTTCLDDKKIKAEALSYIEKIKNTFINYQGMTGKIKELNNNKEYGFFKKGARNKYYNLSYKNVLALSWE